MTDADEKSRRRKRAAGWTGVGLAATLVLGGLIGANTIEPGLTDRANEALSAAGIEGVDVRFDGREAFLSSDMVDAATLDRAAGIVGDVYGVRWVSVEGGTAAPEPSPEPSSEPTPAPAEPSSLTVQVDADGGLVLSGTLPDQQSLDSLVTQLAGLGVPGVTADSIDISGVSFDPKLDTPAWIAAIPNVLGAVSSLTGEGLAAFPGLGFAIDGDSVTLQGEVDSDAVRAGLQGGAQSFFSPWGLSVVNELTVAAPPVDFTEAERAELASLAVYFGPDSAEIRGSEQPALDRVIALMSERSDAAISLIGHINGSTSSGTDELSVRRAQAVKDYLVFGGIAEDRITIADRGGSEPVGNEAGNRRVTFEPSEG